MPTHMLHGLTREDMTIEGDTDEVEEIEPWEEVTEEESPTSGLEQIVNWDDLEKRLEAGEFAWAGEFNAAVKRQFKAAGAHYSRRKYREVIKGLMPECRDLYRGLTRSNPIPANTRRAA